MAITNSLIRQINYVTEAGESYKNSNILKNKKTEIESFLPTFKDLMQRTHELNSSYVALKNIVHEVNVNFSLIINNCEQLKNKAQHDEYDKPLVTATKKEVDRIYNELQKVWKAYINDRTSSIDVVLDTLGTLLSDMPEIQMMQNKKKVFIFAKIGSSAAVEAINEYEIMYESLMGKLNLSEDVLSFLKLLTSGKAVTLNDMSANVYEWIKSSGFAGKINLKI